MSKTGTSDMDPFAAWKPVQDAWMASWSKAMSETVSSEEFARTMGQSLDRYLETSDPMRRQIQDAMEKYLRELNLPTGNEIIHLAERLTQIEMRLDDLDAKTDQILELLKTLESASSAAQNSPTPTANPRAEKVAGPDAKPSTSKKLPRAKTRIPRARPRK